MQNSLKVVTIGSPATQYIFDSRTNPIFDEQLFEHILHIPYLSMMSFQNKETLNVQSNYARLHDPKNVINQILELLPDIVVIDFFADVYFGAVKLDNENYITNNTWIFQDKFKGSKLFFPNEPDYPLLKSHFTSFLNQLKLVKEDIQIVVNGPRFPKYAINAGKKMNEFPKKFSWQSKVDNFNQSWEKLDKFASTLVPVLSFDLEESFADLENPIKQWWFYYNDNYYQDAFIQLEDVIRQKIGEQRMPKFKTRTELSLEENWDEIRDVDEVLVSYNADTKNILSTRRDDFSRNHIQKLAALGYILHGSYAKNARFIKRRQFCTNRLSQYKDVFYDIECPEKKRQTSKPNKLLISFLTLPPKSDMESNDTLRRYYYYSHFKTLHKSVCKDTIIVRVADANLIMGSFYINTPHFPDYEEQIQELIMYLMKKYDVVSENVVVYGVSRGGVGALIHSALGNYKCLAVDPVVNGTWHLENWKDPHFAEGVREIDLVPKINRYLLNSKSNIYVLGNQFIDVTWPELLRLNQEKINLMDMNDETVKEHHHLSPNIVPEQLMYLNMLLNNLPIINDFSDMQEKYYTNLMKQDTACLNLIDNANFKMGNSGWSYWHSNFYIVDNKVVINNKCLQQEEYNSILSNPIKIKKGDTYSLSFKVYIDSSVELDSYKTIFTLRIFNHPTKISQKDAVWFKNFKYFDYTTENVQNEWITVNHSFTAPNDGFLKVGPFIAKNGHVIWKDIYLTNGLINNSSWSHSKDIISKQYEYCK